MNGTLRLWTQLGLGTALAGGLLAACGGEAGGEGADSEVGGESAVGAGIRVAASVAGGEGEGGVAVTDAANDPVAYGIALAVAEAHVIAARDAYAAGKQDAAAEMFAHPASEVLVEMDPVFARLGVRDFKPLLSDASVAVSHGKSVAEVDKRYDAIIAALRAAAARAPVSEAPAGVIATGIIADQIERASAMYRIAARDDRYEPYLDGYGFYKVAQTGFTRAGEAIKAANPAAHARIIEALALLGKAYPAATRPARLPVEHGILSAASSKVMLAASN